MMRYLSPVSTMDRSPFKYQMLNQPKKYLSDTYDKYLQYTSENMYRVDSNHLLMKILTLATSVPFTGDLFGYVEAVNDYVIPKARQLDLTTHASAGKLHRGVFYKGLNEIITLSKSTNSPMDLWYDWRHVEAVKVHYHPVTSAKLFVPIVDTVQLITSNYSLAYLNIDPGLLAAQWLMYRASSPKGTTERFISTVVAPAAFKSHLDLVFFNKLCVRLGILDETPIKTNYLGQQPDIDTLLDRQADAVYKTLLSRNLTARQYLSSVPTLLSDSNILATLLPPEVMRTRLDMWAIHSHSFIKALFVLKLAKETDMSAKMVELYARINRDNITLVQEGWYTQGKNKGETEFFMSLWEQILSMVPEDYMFDQ